MWRSLYFFVARVELNYWEAVGAEAVFTHRDNLMAGKGTSELTVDDLESSGKLQGKNLLDLVKAPKPPQEDTFTLSQSSGLQSVSDPPSSSVISILKKKPPASPSVSSLPPDRKVSFPKDQSSDPLKSESVLSTTERLHKDCPTCTCHLKESSLKMQSLLQSIPERVESDSDLHTMAPLSVGLESQSKGSLQFLSQLKSQFLENPKPGQDTGFLGTPTRLIPYSLRPENSPSRIFRTRLNQRTLRTLGKIDDFRALERPEDYPPSFSPELQLTALRSRSSTSLTSLLP